MQTEMSQYSGSNFEPSLDYNLITLDDKFRENKLNKDTGKLFYNSKDNNPTKIFYNSMSIIDQQGKLHSKNGSEKEKREAQNFKRVVQTYLSSESGKNLISYLSSKKQKPAEIIGYGAGKLGKDTVAAVTGNDLETVILSNYQDNKGFDSRVQDLAKLYKINSLEAKEYVLAHEIVHTAGYKTEKGTEAVLKDYFLELSTKSQGPEKEKYSRLSKVAGLREQEAKKLEN